ncbi:MAG: 50S ribosomal protein L9 [Endomicrobium sp.]|jgi:large subunit ribosomal protein L9|nr:50S ribosomal protein L9 [Endomicrobium sp.]
MKVILKCDIANIGRQGEVKSVASGFARNYLVPKNLVMEASAQNLKIWERGKAKFEKQREELINEAKKIAFKMETSKFVARVKMGEGGKIFGSVTALNLAKIFHDNGFEIKKHDILLSDSIKEIGDYEISVRLHPEVIAKTKLSVISEKEQFWS